MHKLEETAQRILRFIQNNPGCHLRKIKEVTDIFNGNSTISFEKLEKVGTVVFTSGRLYKHYFTVGIFKDNEKEILQFLDQERAYVFSTDAMLQYYH